MQFHVGRFEKTARSHLSGIGNSFFFNLKFTSKLCFVLETFPSNTYSCIFFGEIMKLLYLYLAYLIQVCDQIP